MSRADLKDMTIVFDLDGTLVDTAPDLTNALNDALIRRGHRPIPRETVRQAVGFGARVMIEEALHRAGALEDIDAMLADFLVHYEANIAAESRPFAEGWLDSATGEYLGRPVDIAQLPDGSILVSDDTAGAIYRIWYEN